MQLSKDYCVFTKYLLIKSKKTTNTMRTRILLLSLFVLGIFAINPVMAEEEKRDVPSFSEIALKISAKVYLKQGDEQSVRIVAKESVLEDIITEVKGRKLSIHFPNTNFFQRNYNTGKIEIYIIVPEVDRLSVSGSGDIQSKELRSRILDLAVSGSGNIDINKLDSKRVKASISGSGNVKIGEGGVAEELNVSISGSGNLRAEDFEANNVQVSTSGSGSCSITTNGSLKARVAGSGSVYYKGNPSVDSSVAGSGRVRKM